MVSQGVPMLLHGDELGRTQKGNNNAYCQDNEISWLHWEIGPVQRDLLAWTRRVLRFRKEHPILRRRRYFYGRTIRGQRLPDIAWFRPDGKEMTEEDWHNPGTRALTMWLDGAPVGLTDGADVPIVDDTLAFLFNAWHQPLQFRLPAAGDGRWSVALDTTDPSVGVARAGAATRSAVGTVEATSAGPGGGRPRTFARFAGGWWTLARAQSLCSRIQPSPGKRLGFPSPDRGTNLTIAGWPAILAS